MQNLQQISEAVLAKYREIMKAGGHAPDDVRKELTSASGIAAYDLEPVGVLLQPVITPLVNTLARVSNTRGGTSSEWRTITSLIAGKTFEPFPGEATKSNTLSYNYTAVTAAFAEIGVRDLVTWGAIDAAKGFETNLKDRAVTNVLFALKIIQEQATLFGRISALGSAPTAPTVTTSTTGGSIATPTSSYNMKVRAIVGMGDGTNTRGRASSATNFSTTGSTSSLTAYSAVVSGAVQYEWYVDDGNGGAYTLQATTGNASVKLTALVTGGSGVPADNSANSNAYNGVIPQIYANSPAANILSLAVDTTAGLGTDFALANIDGQNKQVWDNAKADPDEIFVSSATCARLTNLWLAANGGPVSYVVPDKGNLGALTGGYRLTGWINKITGKQQKVTTHPNMPDGTIMALSYTIPFPTGGDQVGIDVEYSRGYQQVDYALTQRAYEFEVYSREVPRLKFSGGAWIINNASSKTTT